MKIRCFCCGDDCIEVIMDIMKFDKFGVIDTEKNMFSNGIVGKISAGFGLIHDHNTFTLAICDSCLEQNKKRIINKKRYM